MTQSQDIAARLQEVLLDGHWIANTNYKQQIESIDWKTATKRVNGLNTIHVLTYHINYYLKGILKLFEGGQLEIRDQFSFDAPSISSEEEWQDLISEFVANSTQFVNQVREMEDSKLNETFVEEKYGTYLRNIEGVIEHGYYHLGQISLIKKILKNEVNEMGQNE